MSAFICPHVSQDLRQHWPPSSPRHGLDVEQISLRAARSSLGHKLFKPARLMHGHDARNGSAPVGHFNDLPRCNATQDRAGVLTKVSDSDPLHVAHCSTLRNVEVAIATDFVWALAPKTLIGAIRAYPMRSLTAKRGGQARSPASVLWDRLPEFAVRGCPTRLVAVHRHRHEPNNRLLGLAPRCDDVAKAEAQRQCGCQRESESGQEPGSSDGPRAIDRHDGLHFLRSSYWFAYRIRQALSSSLSAVARPVPRETTWVSTGSEYLFFSPRTWPSGWLRRSPGPRLRPSGALPVEARPGFRVAPQVP